MSIGERLKQGRERVALTQEQVAEKLDVPRELLSMWETEARVPAEDQIHQMAELYQVPPDYLQGGTDGKQAPTDRASEPLTVGLNEGLTRWRSFLDQWSSFLAYCDEPRPGPGKPPRGLDHSPFVTDARRAPTLADEVRDYYHLGRNALPHLRAYLDEHSVLVYRDALGSPDESDAAITGAFLNHEDIGFCILVNTDMSPGRQAYTMAHEYAHVLYHYAQIGGACHMHAREPEERFANTFAPHFLVPRRKLRQMVVSVSQGNAIDAYKVIYLATYFRVSYATTLKRLLAERHITQEEYDRMRTYSPRALADRIGLDASHFRSADPSPLGLERYPISILKKVRWAIQNEVLSCASAAGLLRVDRDVIRRKLMAPPSPASPEELREFAELPE